MSDDLQRDLIQTLERSHNASSAVLRQRVWSTMHDHGLGDDLTKLIAKIKQDVATERKRKGRVRNTEYNEPPAALKKKFESVHKEVLAAGTKKVPGTSRSKMKGPIETYKTDMSGDELAALMQTIWNGLNANRNAGLTSSYGAGVGGGRKHTGGVHDDQRLAYAAYRRTLSDLPRTWWPVLDALVESNMNVLTIGRLFFPHVKNENALRHQGRMFIKLLAQLLLDREIKQRGLSRGERPNRRLDEQITREIKQRRMERV